MIDLKNTYIKNDRGELRDLYIDECEKQGIKVATSNRGLLNDVNYILTFALSGDYKVEYTNTYNNYFLDKEVTLSDLKPRTKIEYVKCEDAIFDLKEDYCATGLFFNDGSHENPKYETVIGITELAHHLLHDNVYRKVERDVTWKDELKDFTPDYGVIEGLDFNGGEVQMRIEMNDSDFIKMCHLIYSRTNKPD